MAAIGPGWAETAWIEAGWVTGASPAWGQFVAGVGRLLNPMMVTLGRLMNR